MWCWSRVGGSCWGTGRSEVEALCYVPIHDPESGGMRHGYGHSEKWAPGLDNRLKELLAE